MGPISHTSVGTGTRWVCNRCRLGGAAVSDVSEDTWIFRARTERSEDPGSSPDPRLPYGVRFERAVVVASFVVRRRADGRIDAPSGRGVVCPRDKEAGSEEDGRLIVRFPPIGERCRRACEGELDCSVNIQLSDDPLENVLAAEDVCKAGVGCDVVVGTSGLIKGELGDEGGLGAVDRHVDLELPAGDVLFVVRGDIRADGWKPGASSPASFSHVSSGASVDAFWLCREAPQSASSSMSHGNSVCRPLLLPPWPLPRP